MSLHTWHLQGPCKPSSCTTFMLNPHWGRAATGKKKSSVVSSSLQPCGLWPAKLLCQAEFSRQDTGMYWPILVAIHCPLQFSSVPQSCPTLCDPMIPQHARPPWSLPKLMSIESVMPSNHLILCHPHLFLLSIFPSIRVLSNESALRIRWQKYWSFSFSISPSHEHSGLISFRMDWLDLLAVQRTLKSLLQHHSSKASILMLSALFIVQLSHQYMTT